MAKNKRLRDLIEERNKNKTNTGNTRKLSTTLPSSRKNIELPKRSVAEEVQTIAKSIYNQSVASTPTNSVMTSVTPSVANNLSSVSSATKNTTGYRSTQSTTPAVKANTTVTKNEPKVQDKTAKMLYEAEQEKKKKEQEEQLKRATSTADRIAIKATQIMENTFQKPQQLYDGFQLKDAVTIPVQTATSVASHVIGGVEQVANFIPQTFGYGLAMANRAIGNEKMAERWEEATKQQQAERENARNLLFDLSDRGSVLGTTANQVAEGYGQSLALGMTGSQSKALGNALTFGQGFGNSLHDSYAQEDVEDWQALLRATGHGFSTYIAENAFENLGYGGSKIDDALQNALTKKFNSGFSKALARTGISATGEALEEIMEPFINSKIVDNLINVITEKVGHGAKFDTDLNVEELAESALIGFLSGGFSQGSATIANNVTNSTIAIQQKEAELSSLEAEERTISETEKLIAQKENEGQTI